MNKLTKTTVRAALFLVSMVIAVSAFGLLSAWVMSELGPAQQETIAAINTPWVIARGDGRFVPRNPDHAVDRGTTRELLQARSGVSPRADVPCRDLAASREISCKGDE